MPEKDSRAGQLNAVIDPKLLFLAKLASRYKEQTLAEFIEEAFKRALSRQAMLRDEPNAGHERQPKQTEPLWFENLWDENDVARLFRVAMTDLKLLAPKQREIFQYACTELIKQDKKVTLKSFVEFFDDSERSK